MHQLTYEVIGITPRHHYTKFGVITACDEGYSVDSRNFVIVEVSLNRLVKELSRGMHQQRACPMCRLSRSLPFRIAPLALISDWAVLPISLYPFEPRIRLQQCGPPIRGHVATYYGRGGGSAAISGFDRLHTFKANVLPGWTPIATIFS